MTNSDVDKIKKRIHGFVGTKRLYDVFTELRNLAATIGSWYLNDEINRLEESYSMMMKYAIAGAEDPNRNDVYDNIVSAALLLFDRLSRESLKNSQSSKIYFSTLRYVELQRQGSISAMLESFTSKYNDVSVYNMVSGKSYSPQSRTVISDLEQQASDIFNKIWVTFPLSIEDTDAISKALISPVLPSYFRQLMISALLLGQMEYYDEKGLALLLTVYQKCEDLLSLKALCALLIILVMHRDRTLSTRLLSQFESVKEMPGWNNDVKMVLLQLVRTTDTERVNRKMQDELLPEMIKLRPDLYKSLGDNNEVDMMSLDENPEWQDMLEKSGIADKMKELSELQQEGSDVFMSTFAHLKSYPFFSVVSNWFLPFYVEQTDVADALGVSGNILGEMVASSPFLCNSDKYSFVLSMKSVPASHREMMMSQLDAHNLNLAELQNSELLSEDKTRENIVNKYVQDLYRFFKLHRNHKDFADPFSDLLKLMELPLFNENFSDIETLKLIGEFYFKRKYYAEAFLMFEMLSDKMPPSAQLFQKMGYVKQQHGDIAAALQYYEHSELLNAENEWTLRRIAYCYKTLGNNKLALEYYKRVESMSPDDTSVALNIGRCCLELSNYEEALRYFYKVEFLDEKPAKVWRFIAWTLLLSREYEQSQEYFTRIVNDAPQPIDFFNFAHLYMVTRDYDSAVRLYVRYLKESGVDKEKFVKMFYSDMKYLEPLNVDKAMFPFVIDSVFYSVDSSR